MAPRKADDSRNHDQVHVLSEKFVSLAELRPGPRVEDSGGQTLSQRHLAQIAKAMYSLDLSELYKTWYNRKGRPIEKELVSKAKAMAVDDALRRKCNVSRFQDILRQAFKEEEDDNNSSLIELCRAVLNCSGNTPGTADGFIEVHRIICDANSWAHSLDDNTLRQLASDEPGAARELADGVGRPAVELVVKKLANDLL